MPNTWLITGASSDLGARIALCVLQAGDIVIACSRDIATAKEAFPAIERLRGTWLEINVSQDITERIVSEAVEIHQVNVLVNNAGVPVRGAIEDISIDDAKALFETNFFGAIRCVKGAIPHFRSRRSGIIVNIASIAAIRASYCQPLYSSSAFALQALSKSLAAELEPFNVGVMFVQPGFIDVPAESAASESDIGPTESTKRIKLDRTVNAAKGINMKDRDDLGKATRTIIAIVSESLQKRGCNGSLRLSLGEEVFISIEMKDRGLLKDSERPERVANYEDSGKQKG